MSDNRLTNQVRRLRFEHGQMTQQQLADKVGVTRQTIIVLISTLSIMILIQYNSGGKSYD